MRCQLASIRVTGNVENRAILKILNSRTFSEEKKPSEGLHGRKPNGSSSGKLQYTHMDWYSEEILT